VSTELSWTELRRSVTDLRALLAFRGSGLEPRQRRRLRVVGGILLALTLAAIVVPAFARDWTHRQQVNHFVALLPSMYLGFLALSIFAAVASAGGREVIPRDQAVGFPVSSTTDHLGALLMAPLNIAWILQAWTLLGATSYVLGAPNLWASTLPILVWIAFATAFAQLAGWAIEGVRRGPHGILITRGLFAVLGIGTATLILTHRFVPLVDRSPTVRVLLAAAWGTDSMWGQWALALVVLALMTVVAVVLGAAPARWALHRTQREELRLESGLHPARPRPGSDLAALLRVDRSAIWRSVPLRRGLVVLAVMPGVVALAGNLEWRMLTILPGLVASGGALLFGVNSWCLDGRGALWRDSLPVAPRLAFVSRVLVLFEVLLAAAALTIVLAALRAGWPTGAELAALLCATLVVAAQVVSTSLRWSVRRPYAMDMRSARATPAPPVVMAGYSARLALKTTFTGLIFSGLATLPDWRFSVVLALPMLLWSAARLVRTADQWGQPDIRARVVATVAS
jgi:hypothetical protein